jgi:hypothetical protein
MQLKVTHKIQIVPGKTPGSLAAVPQLLDPSGEVLEEGDETPLTEGVTLTAGPISVEVESPFKFQGGSPSTPAAAPAPVPTGAVPMRPAVTTGRR